MPTVVKQVCISGALLALSLGNAFADEVLKPFVLGYKTSGDMQTVADEVASHLGGDEAIEPSCLRRARAPQGGDG